MTTLRLGEGLVGLIARRSRAAEPRGRARPSRLRLPSGDGRGPLQRLPRRAGAARRPDARRARRPEPRPPPVYGEDETEAMLTTATILAEMIATSDFDSADQAGLRTSTSAGRAPSRATSFTDGIALGKVVLHDPRVVVTNFIAEDTEAEMARLAAGARDDARLDRRHARATATCSAVTDHREILETYRMFANDRGWVDRLTEAIENGLTAEAAVERVQNDTRARMLRQTDPYIRDRLHDLDDLANRLLRVLTGDGDAHRRQGAAGQRHPRRPQHGAGGTARIRPHASCAASCSKRAGRSAMSRSSPARSGSSRSGRPRTSSRCSESGRRHHRRRRRRARCTCGRRRTSSRSMSTRCGSAQAPRALPRTARQAVGHPRRHRDHAAAQFGARRRSADARRHRRGRRRAVPHRTAVHDREQAAAAQGAGRALPRGDPAHRRPADRLPPARYRRRQGHPLSCARRSRRTRPWASARCASRSTGRACCASRSARCCMAADGGPMKILVPMVTDAWEFRADRGWWSTRKSSGCSTHGEPVPTQARTRRHDRSALAAVRARPAAARGRLRLDRLERPGACS